MSPVSVSVGERFFSHLELALERMKVGRRLATDRHQRWKDVEMILKYFTGRSLHYRMGFACDCAVISRLLGRPV